MPRVKKKTEVATLKLTPECRAAWVAAATAETRSLANMFEIAIFEYCKSHHVDFAVADLQMSDKTAELAASRAEQHKASA